VTAKIFILEAKYSKYYIPQIMVGRFKGKTDRNYGIKHIQNLKDGLEISDIWIAGMGLESYGYLRNEGHGTTGFRGARASLLMAQRLLSDGDQERLHF